MMVWADTGECLGEKVKHVVRTEPQPIADQIMVSCSCGWREAVSVWEDGHAWVKAREIGDAHLDGANKSP